MASTSAPPAPGPDLLVRGAHAAMTGLDGDRARAGAVDIRIRDGRIRELGRLDALPGERVLDASGCVVYPGWVNTHHHLFQSVLKAVPAGINAPLSQWLVEVTGRYRHRIDGEALRVAARIGLVELMLSGLSLIHI